MKRIIICFAATLALFVSTSIIANANSEEHMSHNGLIVETHVTSQGAHCSGTVGCSCTGFSPITNGEIWQQAYCKHCGHKRNYHR